MNRGLIVFSLLILVASITLAEGVESGDSSGLSLNLVIGKDKSSGPTIDYNKKFQVLFTNRSKEPIRLWSERCQLGHATLSFRVEDGSGRATIMGKRIPDASAWKDHPPKSISIPPGGKYRWSVAPTAFFWGEREWFAPPEPNTGTPFTLTAIFEIKPTGQGKQQGVWTGRITSQPVKALVVQRKAPHTPRIPFGSFPKAGARIMQADRKWIDKQDDMYQTPLHIAARFGFFEVVRWLLSNGADVNARAYNQFTPLLVAEDPEMVKFPAAAQGRCELQWRGRDGAATGCWRLCPP